MKYDIVKFDQYLYKINTYKLRGIWVVVMIGEMGINKLQL